VKENLSCSFHEFNTDVREADEDPQMNWSDNFKGNVYWNWCPDLSSSFTFRVLPPEYSICISDICSRNCWAFGLWLQSGILKNTTFRKLDLIPSSSCWVRQREVSSIAGPQTPVMLSVIYHGQIALESKHIRCLAILLCVNNNFYSWKETRLPRDEV
jgi:hypothetical protein